jgi:hypothetical protein
MHFLGYASDKIAGRGQKMIDVKVVSSRIKHNCNISDARHWGSYSLCGLLLRIRELYRSEMGVGLWEKIEQKEIGEWIAKRESLWKELEGENFRDISINGNVYGPFEVEKINAQLEKEGLVYGAGFGLHMKPSFFLADIISKKDIDGYEVYLAGDEYARDLSDYPAMLQDRSIFARVTPTRLLLWSRFEEMRYKKSGGALAYAFSEFGISPEEEPSEDTDRKISGVARSEAETYIHHELGEAFEGEKIGEEWKIFLSSLDSGKAELFARAVKDVLSDTSEKGMLRFIIDKKKGSSLAFYIVFLGGLRKVIFPEILGAFEKFAASEDWTVIDKARKSGYSKAEGYAARLLGLYRKGMDTQSLTNAIDKEILSGLL